MLIFPYLLRVFLDHRGFDLLPSHVPIVDLVYHHMIIQTHMLRLLLPLVRHGLLVSLQTVHYLTVYGILGWEVRMLLKQISRHLVTKWECPPSQVHKYVHTHMSVVISREAHRFL